jgi:aquaporin Z
MIDYLTEFVGTFIFIFVILNVTNKSFKFKTYAAFIIGITLFVLIQFAASISGGNFNPAVSIAMVLNNSLPKHKLILYILSQILGGITAKYVFNYIH